MIKLTPRLLDKTNHFFNKVDYTRLSVVNSLVIFCFVKNEKYRSFKRKGLNVILIRFLLLSL